jgi:phosphatidylserine decarboxylase
MIAREGLTIIGAALIVTILCILGAARFDSRTLFVLAVISGLMTLFSTYFFRDPERAFTPEEDQLIAPADGRIVAIERLDNHPFIGGPAVQISIFLSVFDVHINRIPADGTIDYVRYHKGKFMAAFEDKASLDNEQTEIGMTATGGRRLVFKQIAGLIARRIVCRLSEGQAVTAGERFGLIKFGSRTDLIIPADSQIEIKMGQKVSGSETVIGYLPALSSR